MVRIENLYKSYTGNEVLSNISLNVKEGEIHGLIGKSGSGKSTLLRCINGIEDFEKGNIFIKDKCLLELNEYETRVLRKDIGMIFQNFALLERKNVYENIALPLKCWNYSKEEIDSSVKKLLKLVDIEDKIYNMPSSLSGGQRQRVAIARALALKPKILLSDEATSGLDPITTNNILNLLLEINKSLGITIVVVTHEMDVIKRVCERISILGNGEISVTGKVEDLFSTFNTHLMNLTEDMKFNIDENHIILKILIYSKGNDESDFLLDFKTVTKFQLEKANIEKLKSNKLEEYYISINKKDINKTENYLKNLDYLEYKFI